MTKEEIARIEELDSRVLRTDSESAEFRALLEKRDAEGAKEPITGEAPKAPKVAKATKAKGKKK